jgi:hypothetical protein
MDMSIPPKKSADYKTFALADTGLADDPIAPGGFRYIDNGHPKQRKPRWKRVLL